MKRKFLHKLMMVLAIASVHGVMHGMKLNERQSVWRSPQVSLARAIVKPVIHQAPTAVSLGAGLYGLNSILSHGISRQNMYAPMLAAGLIAAPVWATYTQYWQRKFQGTASAKDLSSHWWYAAPVVSMVTLATLMGYKYDSCLKGVLGGLIAAAPAIWWAKNRADTEHKENLEFAENVLDIAMANPRNVFEHDLKDAFLIVLNEPEESDIFKKYFDRETTTIEHSRKLLQVLGALDTDSFKQIMKLVAHKEKKSPELTVDQAKDFLKITLQKPWSDVTAKEFKQVLAWLDILLKGQNKCFLSDLFNRYPQNRDNVLSEIETQIELYKKIGFESAINKFQAIAAFLKQLQQKSLRGNVEPETLASTPAEQPRLKEQEKEQEVPVAPSRLQEQAEAELSQLVRTKIDDELERLYADEAQLKETRTNYDSATYNTKRIDIETKIQFLNFFWFGVQKMHLPEEDDDHLKNLIENLSNDIEYWRAAGKVDSDPAIRRLIVLKMLAQKGGAQGIVSRSKSENLNFDELRKNVFLEVPLYLR